MGTSAAPRRPLVDSEQSFKDFFERYQNLITWGIVAIVVIAGGVWYYVRAGTLKEQHAEQAYQSAMQSVESGNAALAASDLRKMAIRYSGTAAGTEGSMALAKLSYDAGNYQAGIDALKAADAPHDMQYDVHNLIAVGYEDLNRPADAAKEYEAAAQAARFDADRDLARANEAGAYEAAGNRDAAVKIWTDLAKDLKSPAAAEARVRLGELQARVMKV